MDSAKYARHIGRVGALAVALGVGAAVATTPGVAFAGPTDAGSSSTSGTGSADGGSPGSGDPDPSTADGQSATAESGGDQEQDTTGDSSEAPAEDAASGEDSDLDVDVDVVEESTIGEESNDGGPAVTPVAEVDERPGGTSSHDRVPQQGSGHSVAGDVDIVDGSSGNEGDDDEHGTSLTASTKSVAAQARFSTTSLQGTQDMRTLSAPADQTSSATLLPSAPVQNAAMTVPGAVASAATTLVGIFLSPFVSPGPTAPAEPPLLWAILGFVRREIQRTLFNQTPVAVDNSVTTDEDVPVTSDVVADDVEGDAIIVTSFTQPTTADGTPAGTVTQNASGVLVFTPAQNFNGTATYTYTVRDRGFNLIADVLGALTGRGPRTDTATVTVTVNAVDDAPVAVDDAATIAEDTTASGNVLTNDTDVDTPAVGLTAALDTQAAHGTATVSADGTFTYTPAANFNGADSFTYNVSDGTSTATGTVTVTVTPVADDPVGANDSYSTPEDTALTVAPPGVLGNDSDGDGDVLSVVIDQAPAHGTATLNDDGSFTYEPNENYNGPDAFTYTVSDGNAQASATVNITVVAQPDPTVAGDDAATVEEDSAATAIDVLANDSDADGPLTISSVTTPTNGGTVSISADKKTIDYTPDPDFFGEDTFSYTVTDGTSTASADVTVTVTDVPDATVVDSIPVGPSPTGVAVTIGGERAYVPTVDGVTWLDRDEETDGWSVGGTVTVGINPDRIAVDAKYAYVVSRDDGTLSAIDLATNREVDTDLSTAAIDRMVIGDVTDLAVLRRVTPDDRLYAVDSLGKLSVIDTTTWQVVASVETEPPATETAMLRVAAAPTGTASPRLALSPDGKRVYVASRGRVKVIDNTRRTAVAARTSDARAIETESLSLIDDFDAGGDVTAMKISPDGRHLYVAAVADELARLSVRDTETLVKSNEISLRTRALDIAVSESNNRLFVASEHAAEVYDAAKLEAVASIASASVAVAFVPRLSTGATTDLDTVLIARPDRGDVGVIKATKGFGSVAINPDTATVDEDASVGIDVLANDDGDGLTPRVVAGPRNGTVTVNADGTITYTPNSDFSGADDFTYTASGVRSFGNVATVTVTVNPVADAPVAGDDAVRTGAENSVTFNVLANDSDPDPQSELTVTAVSQPSNGTVEFSADGTVTYRPNTEFNGVDTFAYTVSDGALESSGTITVTVTPPVTITLTWDSEPRDLDAHLIGPSGLHVFYGNMVATVNGTERGVFLAEDDVDGVGPEVMQINARTPGRYLYYVHRFAGTESLAQSQAVVTVDDPLGGEPTTFPVDVETAAGDYWSVFTLTIAEDGSVTVEPIDTYGDSAPALEVQAL